MAAGSTVGVETCWPEGPFWGWHLVDPNDTNQSWKVPGRLAGRRPGCPIRKKLPLPRADAVPARSLPQLPIQNQARGARDCCGLEPTAAATHTRPTLPSLGLGTVTVEHHKGSPSAPQQTPLKVVRLRERPPSQMYTCSDPRSAAPKQTGVMICNIIKMKLFVGLIIEFV